MALSLLVYKVAQIRKTLKRTGSGVKNQLGRLTDRPTLRWIFQCFQSIHIYIEHGIKQISNINEERLHFLKFFPPAWSAVLFTNLNLVKKNVTSKYCLGEMHL